MLTVNTAAGHRGPALVGHGALKPSGVESIQRVVIEAKCRYKHRKADFNQALDIKNCKKQEDLAFFC